MMNGLRKAFDMARLVRHGGPAICNIAVTNVCNATCDFCNYAKDKTFVTEHKWLDFERACRALDILHSRGIRYLTFSGGEPLLHPELDLVIARIRRNRMIAGMITNGYLLTAERIHRLNRAGLDHLQISIDNVMPDEVSKKSLKVLDKKLELLAVHADFHVNINSVVGGGIRSPQDALVIGRRALELGFTSTVGIIHDGEGQLQPLRDEEREVYTAMRAMEKSSYARINYFQDNIAHGKENHWRCRAGARYLYICEDGLVHYCSQQRGYPAKPLMQYTTDDIRREYLTAKGCAPRCTVACVHQVGYIDFWRDPQTLPQSPVGPSHAGPLVQLQR
jgi:MoaA/NifB/PqqE/SkfB family radical SAM enzyme